MNDKEKEQKAFNQCADALTQLENKSIYKVFQLLSIHFDLVTSSPQPYSPTEQSNLSLPQVEAKKFDDADYPSSNGHKGDVKKPKKKTNAKSEPEFLADFDFMPNGYETLEEFYSKFNANTNLERNLVFIYYFQHILKLSDISVNHVYSAYKHLKIKTPSFPSTLTDTKSLKSWIETSNFNDLRTTRTGTNFLEHDKTFKKGSE